MEAGGVKRVGEELLAGSADSVQGANKRRAALSTLTNRNEASFVQARSKVSPLAALAAACDPLARCLSPANCPRQVYYFYTPSTSSPCFTC